jgi:hypothetical protein
MTSNKHFVHRIQESDVEDVLKKMKGGKAMGSDSDSLAH